MGRNGSRQIGAALVVGLLFFIGCGGKPVTQQKTQTVQVQITDQGIQMPPSLPAGATTFEVSNTGSSEHSFGIAGPAGDKKLEEPLKPGESASLDVFLDSGSYRVYSPVDQGVGMQIALNVLPEPVGRSSRKG